MTLTSDDMNSGESIKLKKVKKEKLSFRKKISSHLNKTENRTSESLYDKLKQELKQKMNKTQSGDTPSSKGEAVVYLKYDFLV